MRKQWDNLRPFEKRVVVVVSALVFAVFNFWFVFPHFSDWGKVQQRMAKAQRTLKLYDNELGQTNKYAQEIKILRGLGPAVQPQDQSFHFSTAIQTHAAQAGVNVLTFSPTRTRTNDQFFVELSEAISTQSTEQQLVDFLYRLGSEDSLIRVRDLGLKPDPQRYALVASVTLVASYQKAPQAKPAATAAPAGAPRSVPPAGNPPAAAPKPGTPSPNPAASPAKSPASPAKPSTPPGKPGTQTNRPLNKPVK